MVKNNGIYFIEGVADKDLLGYDSYVRSLNNAMKSGAKFIGLISDYGNGKSTLLKMLRDSEFGDNYNLVNINLWNCDENNKNENSVDIHKVFLHQLIEVTKIKSKKYYKKKIDKNYSIFDIKGKNKNKIHIFFLSILLLLCLFDKLGFIVLFQKEVKLLGFFLISVLCILNVLIYQPIISFRKSTSTPRKIDENDTKDLYNEIIEEYFKNNNNETLVICLEELDRYNNYHKILDYLKEFYKFYKESYENNSIVFIISIKSASQLLELKKSEDEMNVNSIKSLYEKLFDYILNLRPINIHDYDAIVLELLNEKKSFLPSEIKIPNDYNLKEWKYLYKGNNIKIRDIKHRYNFAISLYLSLKETDIKPDIGKCLYLSYLEDEHNELYNLLITKKDLLNKLLLKHVSKEKVESSDLSEDNIKIIIEGLNLKYISFDYNYYFYKFPLNKKPFNIYEYDLYSAIFYDTETDNINISLAAMSEDEILNIIEKRPIDKILPEIIFKYEKLYIIIINKLKKELENTIYINYNIIKNYDSSMMFLQYTKKLPKKYFKKVIEIYKKVNLPEINKETIENRAKIRLSLCEILGDYVDIFSSLFFDDNNIISKEEIDYLTDFRIIFKLINFEKLDNTIISTVANKINIIKQSYKKDIIKLIEKLVYMDSFSESEFENFFYSINFKEYNFSTSEYNKLLNLCKTKLKLDYSSNYKRFIEHINYYSEKYDDYYLQIINNGDKVKNTKDYKNVINKFELLYYKGMEYLDKFGKEHTVYAFNKNVREIFYKNKYFDYYVISTRIETGRFEIEYDKFDILGKYYIREFEYRKNWTSSVSTDMLEYLYKNVAFSKLNSAKLMMFIDKKQTLEMIKAVLATNEATFINKYLSKISILDKKQEKDIFIEIAKYKAKNKLGKNALKNLKALTKVKKYQSYLDGRKKIVFS